MTQPLGSLGHCPTEELHGLKAGAQLPSQHPLPPLLQHTAGLSPRLGLRSLLPPAGEW